MPTPSTVKTIDVDAIELVSA
jgi:hypothetical protein